MKFDFQHATFHVAPLRGGDKHGSLVIHARNKNVQNGMLRGQFLCEVLREPFIDALRAAANGSTMQIVTVTQTCADYDFDLTLCRNDWKESGRHRPGMDLQYRRAKRGGTQYTILTSATINDGEAKHLLDALQQDQKATEPGVRKTDSVIMQTPQSSLKPLPGAPEGAPIPPFPAG